MRRNAVDSRLVLPKGTLLDGTYRIARVLGTGGFGITYEAEDINLATAVALKEYYPFDFGDRDSSMSVRPKSERHKVTFDWGRTSFVQEARMLARLDHPSIVRVARVFESNSTAYMVMRLEQGQSFEAWLASLGRPPTQEELDRIVAPLLDALELMHAESFLHRDIAPDNIIVRANGTPVLLDFGAARRAVGEKSRTLTGIVKAGYSPQEQYATDGRLQGPWTDFYALGGVLYRAVTGTPPEESTLRAIEDHMPAAVRAAKGTYRPGFLAAVDACLAVRHTQRPQSVAELRPRMLGDEVKGRSDPARFVSTGERAVDVPSPAARVAQQGARQWLFAAAAALALAGGAYGGLEYTRWSAEQNRKLEAEAKRKAAEQQAAEERARQETEAKRQSEAAAARKKAEEEALAKVQAEAKRLQEAQLATERRLAEERARQEGESKRQADAAASRKKAEDDAFGKVQAEARRLQEEKLAADKKAADERAAQADAQRKAQEARLASEAQTAAAKAGQAGQAERDFQEGERNLYGRGVPRDYAKAREAYAKSAAAGNSGGMVGLGYTYENGLGGPKDYAKAKELYEKASAAGNSFGTNNLGRLYRNGWGIQRDYAKARELFDKAAAAGNSAGMLNLGWLDQNGWGGPQNYVKAREWYEKAAAKGNGQAMSSIGWMHRDGLGTPQDFARAREWFEKAVAANNGAGMHGMGVLHEFGQGVQKDLGKAKEWFEKAAAAGNDFGMNSLGWLYQTGRGVNMDYGKAREWYEKAAATSNRAALHNLAVQLDKGHGGPEDHPRAARLLLEAARLGNRAAADELRGPMTRWTPTTISELKRELHAQGYFKGPVNGAWGVDARSSVDKYLAAGR
jgi:TPR repeat protein